MLSINKDVKIFYIAKYRKVVNKMGFWNLVGGVAGKLAEKTKKVNMYKEEYESMSNSELKSLAIEMSKKYGEESENKKMAALLILKERGVVK